MRVTSTEIKHILDKSLAGRGKDSIRSLRIVCKPGAELMAEALLPEVLESYYGENHGINSAITCRGPTDGEVIKVTIINNKGPKREPFKLTPDIEAKAADARTKAELLEELDRLNDIGIAKDAAKDFLEALNDAIPSETDSKEVVIKKLMTIPPLVKSFVKIKRDSPDLWARVMKGSPIPSGDIIKARKMLITFRDTSNDILRLLQ